MENERANLNNEKWSDDDFLHIVWRLNIKTRDLSWRLYLQIYGQKYMDTMILNGHNDLRLLSLDLENSSWQLFWNFWFEQLGNFIFWRLCVIMISSYWLDLANSRARLMLNFSGGCRHRWNYFKHWGPKRLVSNSLDCERSGCKTVDTCS